jgi:hypothetical protein
MSEDTLSFDQGSQTVNFDLELPIPDRIHAYFKSWDVKQVKETWPCGLTGYTKEEQVGLYDALQRFLGQPVRDGDPGYVVVTEQYTSPVGGFPGAVTSESGRLVRALRANFLKHTSELALVGDAMVRCIRWVCEKFDIDSDQLKVLIRRMDRNNDESESDRPPKLLRKLMSENGVSREKADQLIVSAFITSRKIRTSSKTLKAFDTEAKSVQVALMALPELQWIKSFCDSENPAGSFMSRLYEFVEHGLLMRVFDAVKSDFAGVSIVAMGSDCLDVHGDVQAVEQDILARAQDVCEAAAPGLGVRWEWRPHSCVVEHKTSGVSIKDTEGRQKEIIVPGSFVPPPAQNGSGNGRGGGDGSGGEGKDAECDGAVRDCVLKLDPRTELTYEQLREKFSINTGGRHGKVGYSYITLQENGVLDMLKAEYFKETHRHLKYYKIVERALKGGGTIREKKKFPFVDAWMDDDRMFASSLDPYHDDDPNRCCWPMMDMYPPPHVCPVSTYNLWTGFAAEKIEQNITLDCARDELLPDVKKGLMMLLDHIYMLCSGNREQYKFMLDLIAHAIQHPGVKVGIMMCLVGVQGCGKTIVWDMIRRLVGKKACFSTPLPEKDVWGDNNVAMKDAIFVRLSETKKSSFKKDIGFVRTIVSDKEVRVRSLFCNAMVVRSFVRFFADSNSLDAFPDEEDERRFFIILCSIARLGDMAYFELLNGILDDDRVIRVLYDFLSHRVVKEMYHASDIPIGEYQQDLKDANRSYTERFLASFVESQPVSVDKVTFPVDRVVELVQKHRQDMGELEYSKANIARDIALTSIQGVTRRRVRRHAVPNGTDPGGGADDDGNENDDGTQPTNRTGPGRRVTEYTFDLNVLRKRYRLVDDETGHDGSGGGDTSVVDITNTPEGDMRAFIDVLYKAHADTGYASDMDTDDEEGDSVDKDSGESEAGDTIDSHEGLNRKRPVTPDDETDTEDGNASPGKRPCRT